MEKFLEYLVRAFRTRADSASKGMVTQHPPWDVRPWAGLGLVSVGTALLAELDAVQYLLL